MGLTGLGSLLVFALSELVLKSGGRECDDDPSFAKAFEIWKGKQN